MKSILSALLVGVLSSAVAEEEYWMWGHHPDAIDVASENGEDYNFPKGRRIDMAEACRSLDVGKCCVVRWRGLPAYPYDDYARQFTNLDEIAWSIVDSGKETFEWKQNEALRLAGIHPNLTTFFLDDFFNGDWKKLTPDKLLSFKARARAINPSSRLASVLYADMNGINPEFKPSLEVCDVVSLWFWNGKSLSTMRAKVEELRRLIGSEKKVLLGIYLWDFGGKKPLTREETAAQLATAEWLLDQHLVNGLIFHCTPLVDLELDSVDCARRWLRRRKQSPLPIFNAQTKIPAAVLAKLGAVREVRLPDGPTDAVLDSAKVERGIVLFDCPKCDARIRLGESGRWACVNVSRFSGEEIPAAIRRAESLLARTPKDPQVKRPLLGWSTWNAYAEKINESIILDNAAAMVSNGMQSAGYEFVNVDDGFQGGRDAQGRLLFYAPRFPEGLKGTVDGIHRLGFKAGTYSDAGSNTCCYIWGGIARKMPQEEGTGLYGHDAQDCDFLFREYGFDFFKVDYCGALQQKLDERTRYREIAAAIRATGRTDVRLNACRWAYPGTWISEVAESWRTTGDIRANWKSIRKIIGENLYLSAFVSPGHYNDMDMLEVGRLIGTSWTRTFASGGNGGDVGLTPDEEQTHFGMWCMLSSPLLVGCRIRELAPETLRLITNRSLLAMNQNDLGLQGYVVSREGDAYVLVKDALERFGASRYVALYNAGDEPHEFKVPAALVDLGGRVAVLDLVRQADIGSFTDAFAVTVPAHGSRFLRFDAERRIERKVYEAETAFLTAYQELADAKLAGTPWHQHLQGASGGVVVRGLGLKPENDLVWREVQVIRAGRRRLEFAVAIGDRPSTFQVSVDGQRPQTLSVPNGSGLASVSIEIELSAGLHSVRLFSNHQMPDIDRLIISEIAGGREFGDRPRNNDSFSRQEAGKATVRITRRDDGRQGLRLQRHAPAAVARGI